MYKILLWVLLLILVVGPTFGREVLAENKISTEELMACWLEARFGIFIHRIIDKHSKAHTKTVQWNNGKTITQGQLERPFVLVENGKPTHLFFATMDGSGRFKNGTKIWNMVIPLK